ncbi:MAG: helix-turn-helix transcriptional regulator [Kiritimatiellia bacterium]
MKMNKTEKGRKLLQWLREARESKGLTMRDVAAVLKVPHSWIGKVETGDRRLDIIEFARLCQVLGADPVKGLKLLEGVRKGK